MSHEGTVKTTAEILGVIFFGVGMVLFFISILSILNHDDNKEALYPFLFLFIAFVGFLLAEGWSRP